MSVAGTVDAVGLPCRSVRPSTGNRVRSHGIVGFTRRARSLTVVDRHRWYNVVIRICAAELRRRYRWSRIFSVFSIRRLDQIQDSRTR